MQQKSTQHLTEGSILSTLVRFALPFLLANFVQSLYSAVDLAVVGWFSDAGGIAGVATGTQITQIVLSVISGLTMGGTILIAQYVGARREEALHETIATLLTLFLAAAAAFTLVMLLLTEPLLQLMRTPPEAFAPARSYVLIVSGGLVCSLGYNAVSAMLRGMGDSTRPLVFITVACLTNIVLDLIMVGGLGWGAAGAALATVLSQGLSLILSIRYLRRHDFPFDFKPRSFRLNRDKAALLIRLGLPVSLQESLVSVSFLIITAIINSLGVVAAAAVGIAGKFEGFAMLPASAFSGAISAIAAQNMGAGQPERAKRSLYASMGLAFLSALAFFALAQLAPGWVMRLFGAGEATAQAGALYLRSFSFDFMLVAFGFTQIGFFNGCGRTTFAMINGVAASLLVRIPLSLLAAYAFPGSLTALGAAAPLATVCSVTAGFLYLRTGRWRRSVV